MRFVLSWQLNLPLIGAPSCDNKRKRRFAKLDKSIAISPRADQKLARNFGRPARPPPNRLALADRPAVLAQVGGGERRESPAAAYAAQEQTEQ